MQVKVQQGLVTTALRGCLKPLGWYSKGVGGNAIIMMTAKHRITCTQCHLGENSLSHTN